MIDALVLAAALTVTADDDRRPHPSRSAPSADVRFLRCVIAHESGGELVLDPEALAIPAYLRWRRRAAIEPWMRREAA